MNAILHYFDGDAWRNVVTVLLHTLWQAPLVGLALLLALRRLPAQRGQARYLLTVGALMTVVLAGLLTHGALVAAAREVAEPSVRTAAADRTDAPANTPVGAGAVHASLANPGSSAGTPAVSTIPGTGLQWTAFAAVIWITGVTVMLFRAAVSLVVLRRWSARVMDAGVDASVRQALDSLAAAMRITRRVRILLTDRLISPAVMGVIWPVVLLPPAALCGLNPEQLRIVLAHELAHIRRHDYLVNLVQKLIEALLFFNPAVWWISHQIRIEREACCDDLAARVVGNRSAVAHALYSFAVSPAQAITAGPTPALAFGQDNDESGLVDRIRRIARPTLSPAMRLPWYSFVLLAGGFAVAIGLAGRGVDVAVTAAVDALDGRAHVENVEGIQAVYGNPGDRRTGEHSAEESVRVAGTARTHDGRPLPPGSAVRARSVGRGGRSTVGYGERLGADGQWRFESVQPGRVVVTLNAEGYAPAVAGPLKLRTGENKEDIDLVLSPGFAMKLRVLDEHGKPVPDAPIDLSLRIRDAHARSRQVRTNEQGIANVPHLAKGRLTAELTLPGYERIRQGTEASADATLLLQLVRSRPATGQVVSAKTGSPVPHAEIRMVHRSPNHRSWDPRAEYERTKPPHAVADDEGRFALDSLESGSTYTFWFEAPGFRPEIVYGITPGAQNLTVGLHERIVLVAEVLGPLDALFKTKGGRHELRYRQSLEVYRSSRFGRDGRAPVEIQDGKQIAVFDDLILAGPLTISAPNRNVHVEDAAKAGRVTVDLRPKARVRARTVVVKVIPPEGWPIPEGRLRVDYVPPGVRGYRPFEPDLENGQISIDVPLNENGIGKFRYGAIFAPGYWIEEKTGISISAGDGPHVIEVQAHPAGTVYGVVVDATGEPHQWASVRLHIIESPEGQRADPNLLQCRADMDGRFAIPQVLLGGTYRPVADDHRIGRQHCVWGDAIEVNAQHPTHEVRLVMPDGVDVPVQVLGPDGAPVPAAKVSLNLQSSGHGASGAAQTCDAEGRYTFRGVNFGLPGTYTVLAHPTATLAGAKAGVDSRRPSTTVTLRRGVRLEGVLVDDTTGKPMPRRIVEASPFDYREGARYAGTLEARTNDEGRFVFKNLEPLTYRMRIRRTAPVGATITTQPDGTHSIRYPSELRDRIGVKVPRDGDKPLELRVIPY